MKSRCRNLKLIRKFSWSAFQLTFAFVSAVLKNAQQATSTQAAEEIEKMTGIRRSPTQVREFMRRIGMLFRKTGFVPKGTENELKQQEQDEFVKKTPMQIARGQGELVLFLDSAHFVLPFRSNRVKLPAVEA